MYFCKQSDSDGGSLVTGHLMIHQEFIGERTCTFGEKECGQARQKACGALFKKLCFRMWCLYFKTSHRTNTGTPNAQISRVFLGLTVDIRLGTRKHWRRAQPIPMTSVFQSVL